MKKWSWLKDGCPKCGKKTLPSKQERERGWCSSCEVASWPEDKKKVIKRVVRSAFRLRAGKGTKQQLTQAIDAWSTQDKQC